jgi:hypothetical protein
MFINSLAGNIAKGTLETFFHRSMQKQWVQDFLYVAVPVANWISAPFIYTFYHQIPPLDTLFWCGWNWVVITFFFGIVPVFIFALTIPVVLGYMHAIECGGNGTEMCKPSMLELFYSLDPVDRSDVRRGLKPIADFESEGSTDDDSGFNSGTHSSSLRSYSGSDDYRIDKPTRRGVLV